MGACQGLRSILADQVIKCQFGFLKVFYRGIRKNDLKLKLLFALANLWMMRERISDPA